MGLVMLGRQKYVHTAEPLVPEPSVSVVEMAIANIKGHKLPGFEQIPAELIKAAGRKIRYEIHKLKTSVLNKEDLSEEWKESIIVPIYKKSYKRDCSNYRGISLLLTTYKILSSILLSMLTPHAEEYLRIITIDFDTTGPLLIIYSAFVKYLR